MRAEEQTSRHLLLAVISTVFAGVLSVTTANTVLITASSRCRLVIGRAHV